MKTLIYIIAILAGLVTVFVWSDHFGLLDPLWETIAPCQVMEQVPAEKAKPNRDKQNGNTGWTSRPEISRKLIKHGQTNTPGTGGVESL